MNAPARVCVLLCRDCCCGTERKHPEVDHAAQERSLREAAAASGGRVIRTRCLGVCERSNVVVVKGPTATVWFGDTLTPAKTARVADYVRAGAAAPAPPELIFNLVARRARCRP